VLRAGRAEIALIRNNLGIVGEQVADVPEQLDHRDGRVVVRRVGPAAQLNAGAVDQPIERLRLLRPPHGAYDTRHDV
jgi:hypothetical protein